MFFIFYLFLYYALLDPFATAVLPFTIPSLNKLPVDELRDRLFVALVRDCIEFGLLRSP